MDFVASDRFSGVISYSLVWLQVSRMKSINRYLTRCAMGFAAVLVAFPAAAKGPPVAHPALWAVADADTTVYLFGTIHLLPENYRWRSVKLDEAVTGSQQLVVETIVDEKNPQKLMSALTGLGFSKGLPPIAQPVPPDKRVALEAGVKARGVSAPRFRPKGNSA